MFYGCYAKYDEKAGLIYLGNSKIEKVLQLNGAHIRTVRITDVKKGFSWDGDKPVWQRCPIIAKNETPSVSFTVETVETSFVMKPHLKATLELEGKIGTVCYEYLIFPEIAFIYNQNFVTKQGSGVITEDNFVTKAPSGFEDEQIRTSNADYYLDSDVLDCIPLGRRHINVESYKLYDKTDYNDMLVERQNATVYSFKNGTLFREGNIFCINDYVENNSIMMIKHSPTESSALNRKNKDLYVQGNLYASLYGTGIDFTNIPDVKIPYYASAVGVAATEDIHEEMWRYNTAFCTDDHRGSLFCMSNTWGDRSQDMAVCESFMLKEIERAHAMGVDIVQIDDGWFTGITINSKRKKGGVWEGYYSDDSDFWKVNYDRFPNGLEIVVEKAKEYGIEMGLWFGPDSSNDFENYERDIETIMGLYDKYGIRYYKLDGVKIRSKLAEMRFTHMMKELAERSKGNIRFNLDVTAEDRFGYMYQQQYGTIFVENRYTDYTNYFPHNTFKNIWNLAYVIPSRRFQMELLNTRRNADKYEGIKFAPSTYSPDYLFATVMVANPLFWMEMSNLHPDDVEKLAVISGIYKNYKKELFESRVIPIGEMPCGNTFSGYACKNMGDGSYHLILFREAAEGDTYTFALPDSLESKKPRLIYENAPTTVTLSDNTVTVKFGKKLSFVWVKVQ